MIILLAFSFVCVLAITLVYLAVLTPIMGVAIVFFFIPASQCQSVAVLIYVFLAIVSAMGALSNNTLNLDVSLATTEGVDDDPLILNKIWLLPASLILGLLLPLSKPSVTLSLGFMVIAIIVALGRRIADLTTTSLNRVDLVAGETQPSIELASGVTVFAVVMLLQGLVLATAWHYGNDGSMPIFGLIAAVVAPRLFFPNKPHCPAQFYEYGQVLPGFLSTAFISWLSPGLTAGSAVSILNLNTVERPLMAAMVSMFLEGWGLRVTSNGDPSSRSPLTEWLSNNYDVLTPGDLVGPALTIGIIALVSTIVKTPQVTLRPAPPIFGAIALIVQAFMFSGYRATVIFVIAGLVCQAIQLSLAKKEQDTLNLAFLIPIWS